MLIARSLLIETRQALALERTAAAEQRQALKHAQEELSEARKAERALKQEGSRRGMMEEQLKAALDEAEAARNELASARTEHKAAAARQQAAAESELSRLLREQRTHYEAQIMHLKKEYEEHLLQLQHRLAMYEAAMANAPPPKLDPVPPPKVRLPGWRMEEAMARRSSLRGENGSPATQRSEPTMGESLRQDYSTLGTTLGAFKHPFEHRHGYDKNEGPHVSKPAHPGTQHASATRQLPGGSTVTHAGQIYGPASINRSSAASSFPGRDPQVDDKPLSYLHLSASLGAPPSWGIGSAGTVDGVAPPQKPSIDARLAALQDARMSNEPASRKQSTRA